MSLRLNIYNRLVNEVSGIREAYMNYRQTIGSSAIKSYGYLLYLNFQYHVLRNKSIGRPSYERHDEKIIRTAGILESALVNYGSVNDMLKRLNDFDVISFDVFDTLIFRALKRPVDLFYFLDSEFHYSDLKRLRVEAECAVRDEKYKLSGHREVSLEEIWAYLEKTSGVDSVSGVKKEFMLEKKYCMGNPFFMELIPLLKAKGKKIVACSDMYLGKERIQELLRHCGYDELDDYIVSSDYNKSKKSGELFDELLKYGKAVHIGDNPHSDVEAAKSKGITPIYYANVNTLGNKYRPCDMGFISSSVYSGLVNAHLYNGLNKYNAYYEFGFTYGGLLVTGYCRYIHDYARKNNIDKLLFLSRDGDIIYKIYKRMYPDEADNCAYVWCSRLAVLKLCGDYYREHYFKRFIDYKVNNGYRLESVLETMDLLSLTPKFISEEGLSLKDELDKENAKILKDFLIRHWEEVNAHYATERNDALAYYGKIINASKHALVVDSGWMGSSAIMLKHFLSSSGCRISGMMLGSLSMNSQESDAAVALLNSGELNCYSFCDSANRDIWKLHDASKGHNLITELVLASEEASFRGFKDGKPLFNKTGEAVDAGSIQRGIMDFNDLFMKCVGDSVYISGRDAFYPLSILYRNKKWVKAFVEKSGININVE